MSTDSQSAYASVIDGARETIVVRARYYKRLVIVVSLGIVAALLTAMLGRSSWPLLALGLLMPLVLVHHAADMRVVHRWREEAIERWARGEMDLTLLAGTLAKVPSLPASTVQGMLACLPTWSVSTSSRPGNPAVAVLPQVQKSLGRLAEQSLLANAAGWVCALASGVLMLASNRWAALAGLVVAVAVVPCWTWYAARRMKRDLSTLPHGCAAPQLNWAGVPDRLRQDWPLSAGPGSPQGTLDAS